VGGHASAHTRPRRARTQGTRRTGRGRASTARLVMTPHARTSYCPSVTLHTGNPVCLHAVRTAPSRPQFHTRRHIIRNVYKSTAVCLHMLFAPLNAASRPRALPYVPPPESPVGCDGGCLTSGVTCHEAARARLCTSSSEQRPRNNARHQGTVYPRWQASCKRRAIWWRRWLWHPNVARI